MATLVRRCSASESTVVCDVPSPVRPRSRAAQRRELADVHAAERERRQPRVDRVGHVVAVDLGVARVRHVHDVAVRPEAARAVVAGLRQLLELLVTDALEVLRFGVLGRGRFRPRGQAVGEEPLRAVVGDPDGDAVGPDAVRVAVGGGELVLGEQVASGEVVGEEAVLPTVEHPHRLVAGPDAARVAVAVRRVRCRAPRGARRCRGRGRRGGCGRCRRPRRLSDRTRRREARGWCRRARTRGPRRARRSRGRRRRRRRRCRRRSRGPRASCRRTTRPRACRDRCRARRCRASRSTRSRPRSGCGAATAAAATTATACEAATAAAATGGRDVRSDHPP